MKSFQNYVVIDLGYGDAGKGTIVDWICSQMGADPVPLVIRFNGGANAGHNVVTDDGRHHTFSQFGSGTLQGAMTHLSQFCLVDPFAMLTEAKYLENIGIPGVLSAITIDMRALLVTPYHMALNKARELARGPNRHGSCGMGIGETVDYARQLHQIAPLVVGDILQPIVLQKKLYHLRDYVQSQRGLELERLPHVLDVMEVYEYFAKFVVLTNPFFLESVAATRALIFEGAQGVLIDEQYGFAPYNTWSSTTPKNARTILTTIKQQAKVIGVTRPYMVRHGPGPLPTEDTKLKFDEPHNVTGTWQGHVRYGHFDTLALRYAIEVSGGIDELALTHLDDIENHPELRICLKYRQRAASFVQIPLVSESLYGPSTTLTDFMFNMQPVYGGQVASWTQEIEDVLGVSVTVGSYGPRTSDKRCLQSERDDLITGLRWKDE